MNRENILLISGFFLAAVAIIAYLSLPVFMPQETGEEPSPESIRNEVEQFRDGVLRSAENKENISLSLDLEEDISITVDGENNVIQVENPRENMIYPGEWQLINGTTLQGTSLGSGDFALDGYDRQSIIAARSLPDGSSVYHVEFREMRSEETIELIDIRVEEPVEVSENLNIDYIGMANDTVGASSGERLDRVTTQVLISSG